MVLEHLVHLFPNFLLLLHDSDPVERRKIKKLIFEHLLEPRAYSHFQDVFEIFDITPHLKFCDNQYPIPVLNHLNCPFSWAAFCVLTAQRREKEKNIQINFGNSNISFHSTDGAEIFIVKLLNVAGEVFENDLMFNTNGIYSDDCAIIDNKLIARAE